MNNTLHKRLFEAIDRRNAPPSFDCMRIPPPPHTVPSALLRDFLMNGKIPVLYWYFDDRRDGLDVVHNTRETYVKMFNAFNNGRFDYYILEGKAFLVALKKYPLGGGRGNDLGLIWLQL
jgi:hypothetical protein